MHLCALMAQAEYGDLSSTPQHNPEFLSPWPQKEMGKQVFEEHAKLEGMISQVARDRFLNFMAKKELYNAEIFKAKTGGNKVLVSVGSSGMKVFERKTNGKLKEM